MLKLIFFFFLCGANLAWAGRKDCLSEAKHVGWPGIEITPDLSISYLALKVRQAGQPAQAFIPYPTSSTPDYTVTGSLNVVFNGQLELKVIRIEESNWVDQAGRPKLRVSYPEVRGPDGVWEPVVTQVNDNVRTKIETILADIYRETDFKMEEHTTRGVIRRFDGKAFPRLAVSEFKVEKSPSHEFPKVAKVSALFGYQLRVNGIELREATPDLGFSGLYPSVPKLAFFANRADGSSNFRVVEFIDVDLPLRLVREVNSFYSTLP